MSEDPITDWDDAYANAAHIPEAETFPPRWAQEARNFRQGWSAKELDVCYGPDARNRYDLFYPEREAKGLVVFVHGGYWLKFDKSYWSQLAGGALARGWAVCLPSYRLAEAVPIKMITLDVARAIETAARQIAGPIRLAGHSAGGHLVTRMICEDTPLPPEVVLRIAAIVSISGLHDLNPLRYTNMNEAFGLNEKAAMQESPALQKRLGGCRVTAWVGDAERPEFVRQSRLLSEAWPDTVFEAALDKHHFDVIDALKQPTSRLVETLLG